MVEENGLLHPRNDGKDPTGAARQRRWRSRHPEAHAWYQARWRVWGPLNPCHCPLMTVIRRKAAVRAIRADDRHEAEIDRWCLECAPAGRASSIRRKGIPAQGVNPEQETRDESP